MIAFSDSFDIYVQAIYKSSVNEEKQDRCLGKMAKDIFQMDTCSQNVFYKVMSDTFPTWTDNLEGMFESSLLGFYLTNIVPFELLLKTLTNIVNLQKYLTSKL